MEQIPAEQYEVDRFGSCMVQNLLEGDETVVACKKFDTPVSIVQSNHALCLPSSAVSSSDALTSNDILLIIAQMDIGC